MEFSSSSLCSFLMVAYFIFSLALASHRTAHVWGVIGLQVGINKPFIYSSRTLQREIALAVSSWEVDILLKAQCKVHACAASAFETLKS